MPVTCLSLSRHWKFCSHINNLGMLDSRFDDLTSPQQRDAPVEPYIPRATTNTTIIMQPF